MNRTRQIVGIILVGLLLPVGAALGVLYFALWNNYNHLSAIKDYFNLEADQIVLVTGIGFGVTGFLSILAWLLSLDTRRVGRPAIQLYLNFLGLAIQAAARAGAELENAVTYPIVIIPALFVAVAPPFLIFPIETLLRQGFLWLGLAATRLKFFRLAVFSLHKALLFKPQEQVLLELLGQALHKSGQVSAARAFLLPLMKSATLSEATLYLISEGYEKQGKPEQAIPFYQALRERSPNDKTLAGKLIDLYLKTEQIERAIPLVETETDFSSIEDILKLERLHVRAGNIPRVRELLVSLRRIEEPPCTRTLFEYRRLLQMMPDDKDLLRELAVICKELGKKEESADYYERLLAQEPENKGLRRQLLEHYIEASNVKMVEHHIEYHVQHGEVSLLIMREYAQLLINKENYESAAMHLLKAKESYPEEYSFPHILSELYYNHKEYDRARSEMAEALRLVPPEKREELQILYRKIEGGILNTQIKELRESIERDPTNFALRFELIEKLMANSYLEGVTSEIDTLLYYHPEMKKEIMAFIENLSLRYERNYLLLDFLADMSLKEGNFDKCMEIYERMSAKSLDRREAMRSCVEKILKLNPSYLPAHGKIGDLAHEAKDLETLISHYRICLEGNEEMMADRLETFFDALYKTGALEEAERVGLSMTAKFPENGSLFTKLGRVYLDRGRFVEAISAFEKAKTLVPEDKETLALFEEAFRREKKRQIDEILKKLEAEPDNSEYQEQAGDLFSFFEDYTEAVKHYQRAAQLAPHPDLCKVKLAFSLARRGMMDLAEETLDEVKLSLTENPDQEGLKDYFYMTAVHFEKELQTQTALKLFKQIFRVDAGYRDVVGRIEKIENLGVTVSPYGKRLRNK